MAIEDTESAVLPPIPTCGCASFCLSEGYFTGMQLDFERIKAKRKIQNALDHIVPLRKQAIA